MEALPRVAANLKVDNYTVLESGEGGVSPLGKMVNEIFTLLKVNDLGSLFGGGKTGSN